MKITVTGFKGGTGKTTTAVHLAAYLQQRAPTILIDGDPNRSASEWNERGGLPFDVADEHAAKGQLEGYRHIVVDTEARPSENELRALARACDLLVIPCTPDALSLSALTPIIGALQNIGTPDYKILLTTVPPLPSRDADEARAMLKARKLPLFRAQIRRAAAFQKAALLGVPVYEVASPRAKIAWSDYEQAGKELTR